MALESIPVADYAPKHGLCSMLQASQEDFGVRQLKQQSISSTGQSKEIRPGYYMNYWLLHVSAVPN
jgi:hypothetical protein